MVSTNYREEAVCFSPNHSTSHRLIAASKRGKIVRSYVRRRTRHIQRDSYHGLLIKPFNVRPCLHRRRIYTLNVTLSYSLHRKSSCDSHWSIASLLLRLTSSSEPALRFATWELCLTPRKYVHSQQWPRSSTRFSKIYLLSKIIITVQLFRQ